MVRLWRPLIPILVLATLGFGGLAHSATERLEVGLDWADDSSCSESTESIALTYIHESDVIDLVRAYVRQAPSGGNCLKENTTADMEVVKKFPLNKGQRVVWSGVAKFTANVRSVSDFYYDPEKGIDSRHYALPVGSETNWNGVLGAGVEIGIWELTFGAGVVPTDFVDGPGRTVHAAIGTEIMLLGGVLEVAADIDTDGSRSFGSNRIEWRQDLADRFVALTVGFYHDWGLGEILPPGPAVYLDAGGAHDGWAAVGTGINTAKRAGVKLAFAL